MKKNKTLAIFFAILIAFFLVSSIIACNEEKKEKTDTTNKTTTEDTLQKSTEDKTTKTEKMIFKFNNGAEPQTLDPAVMTGVPEFRIAIQIFEGLTMYNPKDLSADAGVAEKWEVSEDGLVWTFYLRQNAKWSDGTPIDAETFAYSWRRAIQAETAADYAYQLWYIKNAEKYTNGEVPVEEVGIEVVDPYTLRVTLESPTPFFLSLTSFQTYFPVPKHIVEKTSDDTWYKAENIVCNGAFKVTEWKPQQVLKLAKNEAYWDKDKVKLDEIEVYPYEDNNSSLEMFLNGELDWTTEVPSERIDEMTSNPEYHNVGYLGTYFYRLNVTKPPLNDVRVRKALAMTVDRDYIVRYIGKAGQIPAYGFVPSNMPDYIAPETDLTENEKEAKKLLAEAGFPDGKGFPKLSILYNTHDDHKKIAEAVQQMWKEKLGIDVILENQEWQIYLDNQTKLNYHISRSGWIGDYVDPNTFLDMFVTNGGNNNTGWSNPKYDEFINNAKYEQDPLKRMEYFNEAEKLLVTEVPIIPIYYYVNQYMLRSNVEGIYENILDLHSLKEVSIKKVQ